MEYTPGQVDLENRDPNFLNGTVRVSFEDVLGEPDSLQSMDYVWIKTFTCFNCGRNCCYKFLTTLCGLCIGLYWGCEFALLTFEMVWCCTPALKATSILTETAQHFFRLCIHCCLAPVFEGFGMCFSKITVTNISG